MLQTVQPQNASEQSDIRYNWTTEEVLALYEMPLLDLLFKAQTIHRQYVDDQSVQTAALLSIKTGACPENCSYCPQSAHYAKKVGLQKEPLMEVEDVLAKAREAKENGASRFCMGAAWRHVRDGEQFDRVIDMVKGVKDLGMEACVTLGMMNEEQAKRLADAGLDAYNHNLDTSPEYYPNIISTRTYDERLDTLANVRKSGVTVCSGGIIGMGESNWDRARLLQILANMDPHPESVPINALVSVEGTPLGKQEPVDPLDMVRMVATARITMPKSRVRLSAGRLEFSKETQTLCFLAGANSIFYGEKLLTTGNNDTEADRELIEQLGLHIQAVDNEEIEDTSGGSGCGSGCGSCC